MKQTTKAYINSICNACDGRGLLSMAPDFDPRSKRLSSGKSLRAVAQAMEISAAYLSDLERGNRAWSEGLLDDFKKEIWLKVTR